MSKEVYIWYSGATDLTGRLLAEKLGIEGGTEKPDKDKKVVLCWGTKTPEKTTFPEGTKVFNHPDNIRLNRNKLEALRAMAAAHVPVAKFFEAGDIKKAKVNMPLVGRTKFHQGGKGFWLCLSNHHVSEAIKEGAQYFQEYIPVKSEYRLHLFGKECICTKKVKRGNMKEAFIDQTSEKAKNAAERKGVKIDEKTMDFVLKRVADTREHPDHIVKSNTRGWKFTHMKDVDAKLKKAATKALVALGLDYGAVDCCLDENGNPWVIEVNTGPGLKGVTLEKWTAYFKGIIAERKEKPKKNKAEAAGKKGDNKKAAAPDGKDINQSREYLKSAMQTIMELVEVADEDEIAAIRSAASKVFLK